MNKKQQEEMINKGLEPYDGLKFLNVNAINHDPHPYMVGAAHLKYANEHYSGQLGEETMNAVPCAVPKCGLMYHEHKYDVIAFFQLQRNITAKECTEMLQAALKDVKGIDGVLFVEEKNNYKVKES